MSNGNKQQYSFESYGLTIPGGDQQPKDDEAGYSFEQYGLEIPVESEWDALVRNTNNDMEYIR